MGDKDLRRSLVEQVHFSTTDVSKMEIEGSKNWTFHDDTTGGVDATLSGDRASGEDVIPGAHLDGNTSVTALSDSLVDTRASRWTVGGYREGAKTQSPDSREQ